MASAPTLLRSWLTLCIALVVLMVVIGGVTRLTESGLSIVKWKLVSGVLPPLTTDAWHKEFAEYKTSPQYRELDRDDFGIAQFKHIYWLEYLHRLVGRLTALAFLLPLVYFAVRRQIPPRLLKRMLAAFVLIALQGAVGWIMVKSGLVNEPRVSPIKLALHLSLAFSLFCLLLWTRLQMNPVLTTPAPRHVTRAAIALFALIFLQVMLGALVAGLRAGYLFNTWPLMDGQFIPPQAGPLFGQWQNHFENMLVVQFQHRLGAYAVVMGVLGFVAYAWKRVPTTHRKALLMLLGVVFAQFLLGIATLLSVVNLWLASLHQLLALGLIGISLYLIFINSKPGRPIA